MSKMPTEDPTVDEKTLRWFQSSEGNNKAKRMEVDHRAAEPPPYHSRESEEASTPDDEEAQIKTAIQMSLDDQYWQEEMAKYKKRFGPSYYESGSGSAIDGRESEFKRIILIREPDGRRSKHSISSLLGAFGSRRSSRDIPAGVTIHDLDPYAFLSKNSKQQRIDTMVKKDKKKDMRWTIGSWFHFSHIPANATGNPYYRSAILVIEVAG